MQALRHKTTGVLIEGSRFENLPETLWVVDGCNGVPFDDYELITLLPLLTPMQLYLKFTAMERIAIKTSPDPLVKEFWETYQIALQTNSFIDLNLPDNLAILDYMSTYPEEAPILYSGRKEQILSTEPL